MRTSNNLFVLKTLIDKQLHKNEKLYCCFVHFSKAFDTVLRKGLVEKLKAFGICGKMFDITENIEIFIGIQMVMSLLAISYQII